MNLRHALHGRRVLVVEDVAILASAFRDILMHAGAEVVGPALTLDAAKRLASEEPLSAALLDIRLNGDEVWPVARHLDNNGVPFVFVTEHFDNEGLPPDWRGRPVLVKPARCRAIIETVANLEREERLRFAIGQAKVGYWEWTIKSGRLDWCTVCRQILGVPEEAFGITAEESVPHERVLAMVHPDDRMRTGQALQDCLAGVGDLDIEVRTRLPDSTIRWIHVKARAVAAAGRAVRMAGIMMDVTGRKHAEERHLRRAAAACEAGRMGAWHLNVEKDHLTYSDELLALMGIDKSQFGGTLEAVEAFTFPDDIERRRKDHANALVQGGSFEHDYRILRPDGAVRWMQSRGTVRRADDTAVEAYGMTLDITERKLAEEHVRFRMKELSHRARNLMAVVQAISWQTARKSSDLVDFEQRFTQRLEALARAHDLLLARGWQGVGIADLVRAQIEPFLDSAKERLMAHGPALLLTPVAAQDLGLALHELATNASKHGALSVPAGKIEIGWTIDGGAAGAQRFHMTWRESGGPTVSPPAHKGFGTTVMTSTLSRSFNGKTNLEYSPAGLSWELAAPVDHRILGLP